jgi:hypothetical protein
LFNDEREANNSTSTSATTAAGDMTAWQCTEVATCSTPSTPLTPWHVEANVNVLFQWLLRVRSSALI